MTSVPTLTPAEVAGAVLGLIALFTLAIVLVARKVTREQLRRWGGEEM